MQKTPKKKPRTPAQRAAAGTLPKARPVARKPGSRGSIGLTPSNKPDEALNQVRRSFGDWGDDSDNPAVELIRVESQLCGRLNTYHEGRWQSRRLGDDTVLVIVKLQDGTQETRKFSRGVLSVEWKRS